jgi:hypothetical protein
VDNSTDRYILQVDRRQKMKHLLDGLKMLKGDFWRAFCKKPAMGFCLLCLVIFFFLADVLWFILTPKDVRKSRWNQP